MQRAVSALRCVRAITASILIASIVPATAETTAIEWDESQIDLPVDASAQAVALAALDPAGFDTKPQDVARPADPIVPNDCVRIVLRAEQAIVGIASFYDDPQSTSSGEQYNPNAYTAAAQLEIRGRFGGIKYGRLYRPAYGLGEYGGKKIIVRFNDVGPLRPGRKFDLSRASMAYFDETLEKGLLPGFRMTPLPLDRSISRGAGHRPGTRRARHRERRGRRRPRHHSGRAGARDRQHLAEAGRYRATRHEGKAASGATREREDHQDLRRGPRRREEEGRGPHRREEEGQSPTVEGRQTGTEECQGRAGQPGGALGLPIAVGRNTVTRRRQRRGAGVEPASHARRAAVGARIVRAFERLVRMQHHRAGVAHRVGIRGAQHLDVMARRHQPVDQVAVEP